MTNSTRGKTHSIRYIRDRGLNVRRRWRVRSDPARFISTFHRVALRKRTQLSKICIARQCCNQTLRTRFEQQRWCANPTRALLSSCPSRFRLDRKPSSKQLKMQRVTELWHDRTDGILIASTIASRVSLSPLLRFVYRAMFITSV